MAAEGSANHLKTAIQIGTSFSQTQSAAEMATAVATAPPVRRDAMRPRRHAPLTTRTASRVRGGLYLPLLTKIPPRRRRVAAFLDDACTFGLRRLTYSTERPTTRPLHTAPCGRQTGRSSAVCIAEIEHRRASV